MDGLSAMGPAIGQTSRNLGTEWKEAFGAIPLPHHFSETGSGEQSCSKLRLLGAPDVQVSRLIDSQETHVLQILKRKGTSYHFPRRSESLTGKTSLHRSGRWLGAMTFH